MGALNTHNTGHGSFGAAARWLLTLAVIAWLLACGGGEPEGGGGGGGATTERPEGVYTGFSARGDLDWTHPGSAPGGEGGDSAGVGAGADGDGGIGAGGDFGQFRNALLIVKYPDGSPVGNGQALTDPNSGMVTIKTRKAYQGPLYLELRGGADASYFEEGKDSFVPFPPGQVIRAWVPWIDKNIGITPFTETAYRLLTEGSTPERAAAPVPTAAEIKAANHRVRNLLNQQFPAVLAVDDITRLPFIKSPSVQGQISTNPRGVYGLVNGAFSKQAAMFNPGEPAPTLAAIAQLSEDLLDGRLDGLRGTQPAVPAGRRTYDPNTLTGELTSALAEQSERFGTRDAVGLLPKVVNFGSARHEGYLFDTLLKPGGEMVTTVTGWVTDDKLGRPVGTESARKLPGRVFGVFGNLGHGGVFLKANAANSQARLYGFGDNSAGELGTGSAGLGARASAGDVVEVIFPTSSVVTHVAGGFAHTVARLADGSVYTWGDNAYSQLGQGAGGAAPVRAQIPIKVSLPLPALSVAATNTASYALLEDGRVFSWGSSWGFGLLGDGVKDSVRNTPAAVMTSAGELNDVVQLVARDNDVMVTRRDGSVWTWGSFPSEGPFSPTDPAAAYRGGRPLPAPIGGLTLQPGVQVRKILAEQGLFVVLTDDGAVYTWGVHYDMTAQAVLSDLQPVQVLGLPKVRDLMPGGYQGYSSRPFDRLTSMAIDYRGNLWKVRGRVAERFDPAEPTQTHRPTAQEARRDCASCHVVLTDWPLQPPAATHPNVCVPPPAVHGDSLKLLINAKTECALCHNPARKTTTLPDGWLNCKAPVLPMPKPPEPLPAAGQACVMPTTHVFTPPGVTCSACHNSVIAKPLQAMNPPCSTPEKAPGIATTATIAAVFNDLGSALASGAATSDATPLLTGTLSAGLAGNQTLVVFRNGTPVGTAVVAGAAWSHTDSGAGNGSHTYTVRVEQVAGTFGASSNAWTLLIDTVVPSATARITGVFGDGVPIAVEHTTSDTTPSVTGSLSAALGQGESLQLLRNGGVLNAAVVPIGLDWTFTEPLALATGSHSYAVRVVDAAGNLGALSAGWAVIVNTTLPASNITAAFNDQSVAIAPGGATTDATPRLQGTLGAALLAGQAVRVLRNDSVLPGSATVSGTNWTYTDAGAADGTHSYTSRIDQGALAGKAGTPYVIEVDTLAPTITPDITGLLGDGVAVANGSVTADTTPAVSGALINAAAKGELVQLLRNGVVVASGIAPIGTAWSYTEPAEVAVGTHVYTARLVDGAGNLGKLCAPWTVLINTRVTSAAISTAMNVKAGRTIASGTATNDPTPQLQGTLGDVLLPGQTVNVLRNGLPLAGNAIVGGKDWVFNDPGAPDGKHRYSARVIQGPLLGAFSVDYLIEVDTVAPKNTVALSSISGDGVVVDEGATTADSTPSLSGVVKPAPAAGEFLQVLRDGVALANPAVVNGSDWSFTEPVPVKDGLHTYTARVMDSAGNPGPMSDPRKVVVVAWPEVIISAIYDANNVPIPSGGVASGRQLTLAGNVGTPLSAGQALAVYANNSNVPITGTVSMDGRSWAFPILAIPAGSYKFSARVEQGKLSGPSSPVYTIEVRQ